MRHELAVSFVNRAKAHLGAGNADVAISDAQEALQLDSRYTKAHNTLAEALKAEGRLEESEKAAEEALKLTTTGAQAEEQDSAATSEPPGYVSDKELLRLRAIFKEASRRWLWTRLLLLTVLLMLLWLHRRRVLEVWWGEQEALGADELVTVPHFTSGFGILSFVGRLQRAQTAVEASTLPALQRWTENDWNDFLSKVLGSDRSNGPKRVYVMAWKRGAVSASTSTSTPSSRGHKALSYHNSPCIEKGAICVLAHLPNNTNATAILRRSIRGRLLKIRGGARSRFTKALAQKGSGGRNILPLMIDVDVNSEGEVHFVPDSLIRGRLLLTAAALLSAALIKDTWAALESCLDFRRHPTFEALSSFTNFGDSAAMVAREIDKELVDASERFGGKQPLGEQIFITTNWVLNSPTIDSLVAQLMNPISLLMGMLGSAQGIPQTPEQAEVAKQGLAARIMHIAALVYTLAEMWVIMLRKSLPGSVSVTPLSNCAVYARDLPASGQAVNENTPTQFLLLEPRSGIFSVAVGPSHQLKPVAEQVILWHAICRKMAAPVQDPMKLPNGEAAMDPRTMPVGRCFEVLRLSRQEFRSAPTREAAKRLLQKAFQSTILANQGEKTEAEQAAFAFDLLRGRLEAGLET